MSDNPVSESIEAAKTASVPNPLHTQKDSGKRRFLQPDMLAVYVAFLAIIFSQLPPLHTVWGKPDPVISIDKFVIISHDLGIPFIHVPVTIHNAGRKTAIIKEMSCAIEEPVSGYLRTLPANTYFDRKTQDGARGLLQAPLGTLSLKPGERWSNTLNCYNLPNEEQLAKKKELADKSRQFFSDYFSQNSPSPQSPPISQPIEITEAAREEFNNEFWLNTGEYDLMINVLLDDGKIVSGEAYSLPVTELNLGLLTSMADRYQYGYGLMAPMPPPNTIHVSIRKKP